MSHLTRRLSATALLLTTLGTTAACSSGNSSDKAAGSSKPSASQSAASSSSTPAWLVDGKVDITKLGINDTDTAAACDKLFGSAQQAAYLAKVDDENRPVTNLHQFSWVNGNVLNLKNDKGMDYRSLVCEISVNDNDQMAHDMPKVIIKEYTNPSDGNFRYDTDPIFGTGPTKVAYVGRTAIDSDFKFDDARKTPMYTTSEMESNATSRGTFWDDGGEITKEAYLAKYKKNNAETMAVSASLIDRAAQHVYGG